MLPHEHRHRAVGCDISYNAGMRDIRSAALVCLLVAVLGFGLLTVALRSSGGFLVVDTHKKSDVILITQADSLDSSYWMGLHLLQDGYGRELLLDARTDRVFFGRSQADWAADFIKGAGRSSPEQVKVCPITADTTAEEVLQVQNCLKGRRIRSVLLVVHDYHSRRSLAIFSRLLPRYTWSIAPVPDTTRFSTDWWRKRQWIRTTLVEWQHLLWWKLIDRWRFAPVE